MIAVMADDLSGAAELACAAATFGFTAEVHTTFDPNTNAEVVAIDTDSRSRSTAEAAESVTAVTRAVLAAKPAWIYKKTDSILRGNVRAEIEAILNVTGQRRALLIPANPSRKRIIRDHLYYVDGVPLSETAFARDPEHPCRTSHVNEILAITSEYDRLVVPDITSAADIAERVSEVDASTLPAGAVDFFLAMLNAKAKPDPRNAANSGPPQLKQSRTLYICGSASAWDHGRPEECAARGIRVIVMPPEIFTGASIGSDEATAIAQWSANVSTALRTQGRAMLAIGRPSSAQSLHAPAKLLSQLVQAVASVLAQQPVDRLCMEGGATAAAVLRHFAWNRLTAAATEVPGVAALHATNGPTLFIKPGSYPWPAELWVK